LLLGRVAAELGQAGGPAAGALDRIEEHEAPPAAAAEEADVAVELDEARRAAVGLEGGDPARLLLERRGRPAAHAGERGERRVPRQSVVVDVEQRADRDRLDALAAPDEPDRVELEEPRVGLEVDVDG